jgi:hypothetical protein
VGVQRAARKVLTEVAKRLNSSGLTTTVGAIETGATYEDL